MFFYFKCVKYVVSNVYTKNCAVLLVICSLKMILHTGHRNSVTNQMIYLFFLYKKIIVFHCFYNEGLGTAGGF